MSERGHHGDLRAGRSDCGVWAGPVPGSAPAVIVRTSFSLVKMPLHVTISRVLIANRGEIAVRIIRACQALGIETVLAISDADRDSLPARLADRTICIGSASAADSYLNFKAVVTAALGTGSDAGHPGYGFLAEWPEIAETCAAEGLTFVGPTPEQIRKMGDKLEARALARQCGVPTLPGSEK